MKKVTRDDIIDYQTYEEQRDDIRRQAMDEKSKRRVALGDNLMFLFENTDTVRYQIQEMMRTERIVKEDLIKHEIHTYNELLGEPGELGCTLLIEFMDPETRDQKLRQLLALPQHIYLELADGSKAYARFDERQVGDDRVSSVQFLKFKCPSPPVAIGTDHSALTIKQDLTPAQKSVLAADLV